MEKWTILLLLCVCQFFSVLLPFSYHPHFNLIVPYHETSNLLSISIDLSLLNILYKWNHVICGPLWLPAFTYHHAFKAHRSFLWLNNILLYGFGLSIPSADGHSGCFHCLAVTNNTATAFCAQLAVDICFHFSSEQPGVELLGQMVTLCLTDSCYLIFFIFLSSLFPISVPPTTHTPFSCLLLN